MQFFAKLATYLHIAKELHDGSHV